MRVFDAHDPESQQAYLVSQDHVFYLVIRVAKQFEEALQQLGLVERNDPAVLLVAERIIALAQQGEGNPARLRDGAVKGVEVRPQS